MVEHRQNILVVDDEETIRKNLDKLLSGAGYNVLAACNSMEAENILQANNVDLAILDKQMPDWTELISDEAGIELLETIKETHPEMPVIILTGHPTPETAFDAGHIGAFRYVTKGGMKSGDFLAIVKQALESDTVPQSQKQTTLSINQVEGLEQTEKRRQWLKQRLSGIGDEIVASVVLSMLLFVIGKAVGVLEGGLADWVNSVSAFSFLIVGFGLVILLIAAFVYWQHRS